MKSLTRRKLLIGSISLTTLGSTLGCNARQAEYAGNEILTDSEDSLTTLFNVAPEAQDIYEKSAGTLIMPRVTKASFMFGGTYGEGVLKIGGELQ
ncbi:MAG: hypothetical protein ACJZ8I_04265 [Paracoccaceae bacterium]